MLQCGISGDQVAAVAIKGCGTEKRFFDAQLVAKLQRVGHLGIQVWIAAAYVLLVGDVSVRI